MTRESIPPFHSIRKETGHIHAGSTHWDFELLRGSPGGAIRKRLEERLSIYSNTALDDVKQHGNAHSGSTLLQCLPAKHKQHRSDTRGAAPVAHGKTSSSSLYRFEPLDIHHSMWRPGRSRILQCRAHKGFVALCLDWHWCTSQVSLERSSGGIGLLGYPVHMCIPA